MKSSMEQAGMIACTMCFKMVMFHCKSRQGSQSVFLDYESVVPSSYPESIAVNVAM